MQLEKVESVTKEQVDALKKSIKSVGAMLFIEWDKIDFSVGRGVLKDGSDRYEHGKGHIKGDGTYKHCLWTNEGKRINVTVSSDGAMFISQDELVDDYYFELKEGCKNGD